MESKVYVNKAVTKRLKKKKANLSFSDEEGVTSIKLWILKWEHRTLKKGYLVTMKTKHMFGKATYISSVSTGSQNMRGEYLQSAEGKNVNHNSISSQITT